MPRLSGSRPRSAAAVGGRGHTPPAYAAPGWFSAVWKVTLPRKLGRSSKNPDLRGVCAGARVLVSTIARIVSRKFHVSQSEVQRVSWGSVWPVASEDVRPRTDGTMVGPDPAAGSKAPMAEANSWGSRTGGRGKQRPGLPLWPPPQALRVLVQSGFCGGGGGRTQESGMVWGGSAWNGGVPDSSGVPGVWQSFWGLQRGPWCREMQKPKTNFVEGFGKTISFCPWNSDSWSCTHVKLIPGVVCADLQLRT